jgi:hypothetical protein
VLLRLVRTALFLATLAVAFSFVRWWDFTLPSVGHQRYQAVFLANGQTYFGRYYDRLGPYVKVVAPYYIQTDGGSSRIVRRGSELHGPETEMLIPKSAILFVEDLAPTSPVGAFMSKDAP